MTFLPGKQPPPMSKFVRLLRIARALKALGPRSLGALDAQGHAQAR